jgi:FkbM family methyltransferase
MKQHLRRRLRTLVDHLLTPLQLKLVNRHRTPRGCFDALRRIKDAGQRIEHVIDVGAADGQWALQCLQVFPRAQYWLIEARPCHTAALRSLQSRHPNLQFHIGTVGAESKPASLYEHGNQTSVLPSEYAASSASTTTTVELQTIDSLPGADRIFGPTMIKLDVQGYELEVLRGCEHLLREGNVPLLLTEVSLRRIYDSAPLAHEVIHFAANRGFRMFDICSYCPRPHDLELAQCDILFAREDCGLFEYEGWE